MDDLRTELELSGTGLIFSNDLHSLPRGRYFPICDIYLGIKFTQRIEAMGRALKHLSDQVFLERKIVTRDRKQRQDIARPYRLW